MNRAPGLKIRIQKNFVDVLAIKNHSDQYKDYVLTAAVCCDPTGSQLSQLEQMIVIGSKRTARDAL